MILRHVVPGEPLDRRAKTYNAFVDAANGWDKNRAFLEASKEARYGYPHGSVVKVKNLSGSACDIFNILQLNIDRSVIDYSATASNYILEKTVLEGVTPGTNAWDPVTPIAILLQPAGVDQIVDGLISGVVTCVVDIKEAHHAFATTQVSRAKLVSSQFGQAAILDRENGDALPAPTDGVYCKVLVGSPTPLKAKAKINNGGAITANGSGLVDLVHGSTVETNSAQITAEYNWMTNGAASIADGTEVLIEYFAAERSWVIVGADCP